MIADADAASIDTDEPRVDGKVTFEEFEAMMSSHNASKSASHWRTILEKVPLVKGAKKAISRLNDMNTKKNLTAEHKDAQAIVPSASQVLIPSAPSKPSSPPRPDSHSSPVPSLTIPNSLTHSPTQTEGNHVFLSDRDQAIRNAKWSLSILTGVALFRRLVFKL
jgi:hypothetical protein